MALRAQQVVYKRLSSVMHVSQATPLENALHQYANYRLIYDEHCLHLAASDVYKLALGT